MVCFVSLYRTSLDSFERRLVVMVCYVIETELGMHFRLLGYVAELGSSRWCCLSFC